MPAYPHGRPSARVLRRRRLFNDYPSLEGAGTAFIGDSLIQNAQWGRLLPHEPSRNFGIGGDTAEGVFVRRRDVMRVHPARIVLLIGTNDISHGSADDAPEWVTRTLEDWRRDRPHVRLAVLALPPRAADHAEAVADLNRRLAQVAGATGAVFLDAGEALAMEGALDPRLTRDGLHLNAAGYWTWVRALEPQLRAFGVATAPTVAPEPRVLRDEPAEPVSGVFGGEARWAGPAAGPI